MQIGVSNQGEGFKFEGFKTGLEFHIRVLRISASF